MGCAWLAACGGTRSSRALPPAPSTGSSTYTSPNHIGGVPPWADLPHSWAKLESIAHWLEHQNIGNDPFWRVEGRLQLAEGRMAFYRSERGQIEASANAARAAAARADFLRVRSDPEATESQRRRAERGLQTHAPVRTQGPGGLPPGVHARSAWGARPARVDRVTVADVPWSMITIHHSAAETPLRGTQSFGGAKEALRKIQSAHMNQNGWGDVGYHFFIDPAGRVYEGRSMAFQGAHAGSRDGHNHNPGNIGICLLGNFDLDRPTAPALQSLEKLVGDLQNQYRLPVGAVSAHLDYKTTQCPGKNLLPYVRQLARQKRPLQQ